VFIIRDNIVPQAQLVTSTNHKENLRASLTGAAKLARGKLTVGLPRGRARANLQRARENAAGTKYFARALLRHPVRQTCRSDCRALMRGE
jgi:hypothetical protein